MLCRIFYVVCSRVCFYRVTIGERALSYLSHCLPGPQHVKSSVSGMSTANLSQTNKVPTGETLTVVHVLGGHINLLRGKKVSICSPMIFH